MNITGKVVDSTGTLIPNVHIAIRNKGTVTNFKGEYSIEARTNDTLKFSHVGLQTRLFNANKVPDKVVLPDDIFNLDEVVLIAPKKATVTKPIFKTTGFKLGLAALFLGAILLGKPKKEATGLNGFAKVEL